MDQAARINAILERVERDAAQHKAREARTRPDFMTKVIQAASEKAERAHALANGTVTIRSFPC
jgi:ribosomal protein S12 methylthiotransferase accessory factor YcaO